MPGNDGKTNGATKNGKKYQLYQNVMNKSSTLTLQLYQEQEQRPLQTPPRPPPPPPILWNASQRTLTLHGAQLPPREAVVGLHIQLVNLVVEKCQRTKGLLHDRKLQTELSGEEMCPHPIGEYSFQGSISLR